jgi:D-hydroxyproline dehydrogenase subunit gamma
MPARRIEHDMVRGAPVQIQVDGERVDAFLGETVAAALLVAGRLTLRRTVRRQRPRGVFCGMGLCFDCAIVVDGQPNIRACVTPVRGDMRVETIQDRDDV